MVNNPCKGGLLLIDALSSYFPFLAPAFVTFPTITTFATAPTDVHITCKSHKIVLRKGWTKGWSSEIKKSHLQKALDPTGFTEINARKIIDID